MCLQIGSQPMSQLKWSVLEVLDHRPCPEDPHDRKKYEYWVNWAGPWRQAYWYSLEELSLTETSDIVKKYWATQGLTLLLFVMLIFAHVNSSHKGGQTKRKVSAPALISSAEDGLQEQKAAVSSAGTIDVVVENRRLVVSLAQ